jgi:hypothetical protein
MNINSRFFSCVQTDGQTEEPRNFNRPSKRMGTCLEKRLTTNDVPCCIKPKGMNQCRVLIVTVPKKLLDNEVPCLRKSKQIIQYRVLLVTVPTRIAR